MVGDVLLHRWEQMGVPVGDVDRLVAHTLGDRQGGVPFLDKERDMAVTKEVICKGFPVNAVGVLIIWTAWGFFEGFNYVVISDIINRRYPTKCRWLNWGAIICAILCILIHGLVGVTPEDIIEMLATMALIYGMLIIREQTQNAWGVIFVFTFLWNAM